MSKYKSLFSKGLVNSILTLMTGSIVAQLITVLVSPLMTRLYSEEQIGEYTLILTAVSMFGSILCGRYEQSIISESDEHKTYALVKLSLLLTFAMSMVVGVCYSIYYTIERSIHIGFWEMVVWISVLLFFTGVGNTLSAYNNRFKQYRLMAATHVARTVGKEAGVVGLGILHAGVPGLLLSQLLGVVLGLNCQAKSLVQNQDKLRQVTRKDICNVAKAHIRQPVFSVPASFANSFSYSVLNLLVSNMFGNAVLAYYSMSFRMLGLPLSLIGANASRAFFEKASREYDEKSTFRKTFLQVSFLLILVAVPMVVLLMLFAPWAFELFFGEGWGQAGVYVQYLAPMFGVRLVTSALSPTLTICKKQNIDLFLQILLVICAYTVYFVCRNSMPIESFLIGITVAFSIIYIMYYLVMLRMSGSPKKGEKSR